MEQLSKYDRDYGQSLPTGVQPQGEHRMCFTDIVICQSGFDGCVYRFPFVSLELSGLC